MALGQRGASIVSWLLAMALSPTSAAAQSTPSHAPSRSVQVDSVELAAFLDSFVPTRIADFHIPGAVIAVVYEGRVVLTRGYGFANLQTKAIVDPDRTIFRVGSVSKPITATAVLQQVERGRLALSQDVNQVLREFQIPATFPQPVTVAQLLTHTAGFDVRLIATAAPTEAAVIPLSRYLASDLPPRVRPPGLLHAYSNHGYSLLGYLVELADGKPFADAVATNLFRPLGMVHSTFRFPRETAAQAATGYEFRPDGYRVAIPVHPNIAPAASLNTTASDMARFMLAHLEGGCLEGNCILRPETLDEMHRRQFSEDERMPGMTYGFFESVANGRRLLVHGGGIRGFMAGIVLCPETRFGVFVAANNGETGIDLVWRVVLRLMDHVFPAATPVLQPVADAAQHLHEFEGTYRLSNHPQRNVEKAGALRGGDLPVVAHADGALEVFGQMYVEVEPDLLRERKTGQPLVFIRGPDGRVERLLTTDVFFGHETWVRVPWYDVGTLHNFTMVSMLVLFVLALVLRPAPKSTAALFQAPSAESLDAPLARRLAVLLAAVLLLFVVVTYFSFRQVRSVGLLYGVPLGMKVALAVPLIGLPLALALPWCLLRVWRSGAWSFLWRVWYSVVVLAELGFLTFLNHWNLLGFRF